ncbi:MAG: AMP-binding protein [Sulfolobales archaeon]
MLNFDTLYKEFIDILRLPDDKNKEERYRDFFKRINEIRYIEDFNWAKDVVEKIHVAERGFSTAIKWIDLDNWVEKNYTYEDLVKRSNKLVNFLRGKDLSKGSRVYIMLPLVPEIFFSTYAVVKAGFIGVPTATNLTSRDLEYRFKTFPPDAIIADEASSKIMDEALERSGAQPKTKIIVEGDRSGWESFDSINREKDFAEAEKTSSEDIILAFFTSGTTGLPKIVAHTATSYPIGHLSTAMFINVKPGEKHNNLSAPGWAKFAWSTFFTPLSVGATVVALYYRGRLPTDKYMQALDELGINTLCMPPTAWRLIRASTNLRNYRFETLREVVSAGEPLNPEIYEWFKEETGREIRDFYGQTETTAMIGNPPWFRNGGIKPGSFGKPSFMYDIVILDEEFREITEPGVEGHIAVRLKIWRPIGLMKEYIGFPEKMRESFIEGYYLTGDKAYFDEQGYWWFIGRADDVIKTSDYRVGPFEVESVLVEHPAVAEAAVVGSPDPIRYRVLKAFVTLKPGYKPSQELAVELFRHSLKSLPRYKIPRIIEFVEELPKTISGKIRRVELRKLEEAKKERRPNEHYFEELRHLIEEV